MATFQEPRTRVPIYQEADVLVARQRTRELARRLGWLDSTIDALVAATSEIARNMLVHGRGGEIVIDVSISAGSVGVVVEARDRGPGIADIERAMEDGYSTAGGLGLGLSSASRLADDLEITSTLGTGTTVVLRKWGP